MTSTIQIPETREEFLAGLRTRSQRLSAGAWEVAAWVYAWTVPIGGQEALSRRPKVASISTPMPCDELARQGVHGLRSAETVRRYRQNWEQAVKDGWTTEVKPGDVPTLPTQEWPQNSRQGADGPRDLILDSNPPDVKLEAIHEVMRRDPEVATRLENSFVQKAAQDPRLAGKVAAAYEEHHITPQPKQGMDFGADKYTGVSAEIWGDVNAYRGRIKEYAEQLQRRSDDPELSAQAHEEIDRLERTKQLIDGYADELRAAIGISHDDVFARLMRS